MKKRNPNIIRYETDKKEAEAAIEKVRDAIEELAQMVFDEEGTDLVEEFFEEDW